MQGRADLTRVFASWDEWERDYSEMVSAMDAFEDLTEQPIESAERLVAVMAAYDRVHRSARGPEDYLYLRLQLNGADEEARSREHLIDKTDRRWYARASSHARSTARRSAALVSPPRTVRGGPGLTSMSSPHSSVTAIVAASVTATAL